MMPGPTLRLRVGVPGGVPRVEGRWRTNLNCYRACIQRRPLHARARRRPGALGTLDPDNIRAKAPAGCTTADDNGTVASTSNLNLNASLGDDGLVATKVDGDASVVDRGIPRLIAVVFLGAAACLRACGFDLDLHPSGGCSVIILLLELQVRVAAASLGLVGDGPRARRGLADVATLLLDG